MIGKGEIRKAITSELRNNPDKWHSAGLLAVKLFKWEDDNEKQIMKMRIHRSLCYMYKEDYVERREFDIYEYKWKTK